MAEMVLKRKFSFQKSFCAKKEVSASKSATSPSCKTLANILNLRNYMREEYNIKSFNEFIELISQKFDYGFIYRGVENIENHLLIPSVGRYLETYIRNGFDKSKLLIDESNAFRIFYTEGIKDVKLENYWQWLALAQHHGLATRLLDWSYNPNVALFFSVAKACNEDGAVYVLDNKSEFLSVKEEKEIDPFNLKNQKVYLPTHITERIRAQSGLFTISPDPTIPLEKNVIARIRISKACKREIKLMLNNTVLNKKTDIFYAHIDRL